MSSENVPELRMPTTTVTDENTPLSQFAMSGETMRVRSKFLGEDIILAADNADVAEYEGLVVYRAEKARHLVGLGPEMVKATHLIKKFFDGELLDPESTEKGVRWE